MPCLLPPRRIGPAIASSSGARPAANRHVRARLPEGDHRGGEDEVQADGWVAGEAKGKWQQKGSQGGKSGAGDPYGAEHDEVRIFVAR